MKGKLALHTTLVWLAVLGPPLAASPQEAEEEPLPEGVQERGSIKIGGCTLNIGNPSRTASCVANKISDLNKQVSDLNKKINTAKNFRVQGCRVDVGKLNTLKSCVDGKVNAAKQPLQTQVSDLNGKLNAAKNFRVQGCRIDVGNLNSVKSCIDGKVNAAKQPLQTQVSDLNGKLNAARNFRVQGCRMDVNNLNGIKSCVDGKVNAARKPLQDQINAASRLTVMGCKFDIGNTSNFSRCVSDSVSRQVSQEVDKAKQPLQSQISAAGRVNVLGCRFDIGNTSAFGSCVGEKVAQQVSQEVNKATQPLQGQIDAANRLNALGCNLDVGRLPQFSGCVTQAAADRASTEVDRATRPLQATIEGANGFDLAGCTLDVGDLPGVSKCIDDRIQRGIEEAVASNPMLAAAGAEMQSLLALRELPVEPLFQCLAAPPTGGAVDIGTMARQFAGDPPRFIMDMMLSTWDAAADGFGDVVQSEFARPRGESADEFEQSFDRAMSEFTRVAASAPGGMCMAQAFESTVQGMRGLSVQFQREMEQRANTLFEEQILPVIYESLAGNLGQFYTQLTGTGVQPRGLIDSMGQFREDVKRIASSIFTRTMVVQMDDGTDSLNRLACAFDDDDPAAASALLQQVHSVLDADREWGEKLYAEFGLEILRLVGHRYIDSTLPGGGADLVNRGVALLGFGKDTVTNVTCGAAGLIPEAGGIGAGTITEILEVGWDNVIVPAIPGVTITLLHVAHDQFINSVKGVMIDGGGIEAVTAQMGPLGELAKSFPLRSAIILLADANLREIQRSFTAYNDSVDMVVNAAFEHEVIDSCE